MDEDLVIRADCDAVVEIQSDVLVLEVKPSEGLPCTRPVDLVECEVVGDVLREHAK